MVRPVLGAPGMGCGFTHILHKLYHIMISPDVNFMYTPNCRKDNKKHDNKRHDSGGNVL
ncbi:hypothetical protein K360107B91_57060 [Enterocloster bolteae]